VKLRIFCALRHANDPNRYYGGLWTSNFYPALRELGHDILESKTDLLPTSRFMDIPGNFSPQELELRARTTEQILAEVRAAHARQPLHLFLSYFYNAHFDPTGFDELERMGIPSVNFYCNSIYQFELVADIAAKVNYSWHAEKHARSLYKAVGANPVWVQMAADPQVYRPLEGATRLPNAAFVGLRYADRDRWMAALVCANVPVEIYGPGWGKDPSPEVTSDKTPTSSSTSQAKNYLAEIRRNFSKHGLVGGFARTMRQYKYRQQTRRLLPLFQPLAKGPVPFTRICDVFSSHEVILNFSNVWSDGRAGSNLIPHVRLRDFEAPMCRTCFLTGYTDEITEFYAIGKEIDTYNSTEEFVDKVRFYLSHPQAAEQLRESGYQRARRDHTWVCRFEQLFREIGMA
jgi:spore maturation protein CgeB